MEDIKLPSDYKFYSTYLALIDRDYDHRKERNGEYTDFEIHMRDVNFRSYLVTKLGKNLNTVKLVADSLLSTIIKPQRLIIDGHNFYIACDMVTNTYYICYKYLLMVDLDIKKEIMTEEDRRLALHNFKEKVSEDDVWIIYKSRKGYHAFLVSEFVEHNTDKSTEILLRYDTDFYYIVYSYLRGYSVRLNKKKDEQLKESLYELVGILGNPENANDELLRLVNLHIDASKLFINSGISLMK